MSCKAPNNLVDLINFELGLEHKLDDFESSFEQDKLKEEYSNLFVLYIFEM